MGTAISALGLLPIAAVVVWQLQPPLEAFLFAAVAGVLASVVPYSLDLIVLRHISPVIFGLGMSLHPLFAALIGLLFLHELLPPIAWVGILLVVASNALTLGGGPRPPRRVADSPGN